MGDSGGPDSAWESPCIQLLAHCRLVSIEPLWSDLRFQRMVRPKAQLQEGQSGALRSLWAGLLQPKENKTSQSPTFKYSAHNSEAPVLPPDQVVCSPSLPCLQPTVEGVQCAWGRVCCGTQVVCLPDGAYWMCHWVGVPAAFSVDPTHSGEEYHPPHVTTLPPPLLGFQKQSQIQIFRPIFHPTYQAMSQRMCPGLGNTVLCPIYTAHPLNQL